MLCLCFLLKNLFFYAFLSFDDAKVQRILLSAMDYDLLLHKKRISFDVNQVIVSAHNQIVSDNSHFST